MKQEKIKEFTKKPLFDERNSFQKNPEYPRITIITPSYNQAEFLERTILSILNQSYPNLEYIIIDGGSTDESIEIIKKYEKYLSYWVSERDKGQAEAINKGFKMATGDLVAWQNSDDTYLSGALEKVVKAYTEHPEHDIFFGNIHLINSSDDIIREMRFHPFSVKHLIYYDWNLSSQATFWRKRVFEKVGYLQNFNVGFDWEWFIRLAYNGFRFRFIHEFLGAYRIHSGSKFALIRDREDITREILKLYGVDYTSKHEFKKKFRLKRLCIQCKKLYYYIIQRDYSYIYLTAKNRMLNFMKNY
jgi:glycosyltransferase involved in cell wall biosynthesis